MTTRAEHALEIFNSLFEIFDSPKETGVVLARTLAHVAIAAGLKTDAEIDLMMQTTTRHVHAYAAELRRIHWTPPKRPSADVIDFPI